MNDLTGEDKAALLLSRLSPAVTELILGHMSPDHASRLRDRMTIFRSTPPAVNVLQQTLQELLDLFRITDRALSLSASEGTTTADASSGKEEEDQAREGGGATESLQKYSSEVLVRVLQRERAATVAAVVSNLGSTEATEILKRLPPQLRQETTVQMGQPQPPSPVLVEQLTRAVARQCELLKNQRPEPSADERTARMIELIRSLEAADRRAVLARLDKTNPELAEEARRNLYRFSDLLLVDDRTVQSILSEVDGKTLATALMNTEEELQQKVMGNLSRRARETLAEEMTLLGTPPAATVKEAQQVIVQVIQQLDQEGKLTMSG